MPRRPWKAREKPAASGPLAFEDVFPPGLEQPANGDEPAAHAQGDTRESEPTEVRAAASGTSAESNASDELDWTARFDSPEEMWAQFRNLDRLRGRQANEIGDLRRRVRLYERIDDLVAASGPAGAPLLLVGRRLLREGDALARLEEMVEMGEQALLGGHANDRGEVAGAVR